MTSFPVYAEIQTTFAGGERDCFVDRFPPIDFKALEMRNEPVITNGMESSARVDKRAGRRGEDIGYGIRDCG
ncbi:MAG: hypothetical protein EOM20_13835 [Spartobacteria bacterium]|nr:hypothetical protein [Spartobacteria bacterium]